jgi:CubicO group peptidase (beta-lactamase class C family)
VICGQPLDEIFAERVLGPLGMTETGFHVHESDAPRFAALYSPDPGSGRAVRNDRIGQGFLSGPDCLSGGGGLVSTAADYLRFAGMLLNEGELDGTRVLGRRTVRLMASNQLPGHADLEQFGRPLFAETTFDGVGYGLGFSVVEDPIANRVPCSRGEIAWGGAASTAFWVDREERVVALFLTQLLPSSTHPIRTQLRQLVYQSLVD